VNVIEIGLLFIKPVGDGLLNIGAAVATAR
jgi:hypothetical protein